LTSYVVHSEAFIKERRHKLDSFLRLLTAHETIRYDELLCRFLTQPNFDDDNLADPYLHGKFKSILRGLPNTSGLSFDMDSLNTFLSFQFGSTLKGSQGSALGADSEVEELMPLQTVVSTQGVPTQETIKLSSRKHELLENLSILSEVLAAMQEQQDLYERQAHQVNRIGKLF